jgi:hypothetical protein
MPDGYGLIFSDSHRNNYALGNRLNDTLGSAD